MNDYDDRQLDPDAKRTFQGFIGAFLGGVILILIVALT